jgi:SpoU rRNA methylase family enzyme
MPYCFAHVLMNGNARVFGLAASLRVHIYREWLCEHQLVSHQLQDAVTALVGTVAVACANTHLLSINKKLKHMMVVVFQGNETLFAK